MKNRKKSDTLVMISASTHDSCGKCQGFIVQDIEIKLLDDDGSICSFASFEGDTYCPECSTKRDLYADNLTRGIFQNTAITTLLEEGVKDALVDIQSKIEILTHELSVAFERKAKSIVSHPSFKDNTREYLINSVIQQ